MSHDNSTFSITIKLLGVVLTLVIQGALLYGYLDSKIQRVYTQALQESNKSSERITEIEKSLIRLEPTIEGMDNIAEELKTIKVRINDSEVLNSELFRKTVILQREVQELKNQ